MVVSRNGAHAPNAQWANDVPAFLVGVDQKYGSSRVTVHATREAMTRWQAHQLKRKLRQEGVFSDTRVKRYQGFGVQSSRTLEEYLAPFTHDHILYDATGAFERAHKILRFASTVRGSVGERVAGLFWQQSSGRLHTVLNPHGFSKEPKKRKSELARVSVNIRKSLVGTCGTRASDFVKGVKIGFNAPRDQAMPIDARSLRPINA